MKVKVKVIKDSVIYDGKIYKSNTKDDEFECDEVIAKSLSKDGYVVEFQEGEFKEADDKGDSQEEQENITGHLSKEDLEEMTYPNLKKLAKDMGIPATGTKEELIEKIVKEEVEIPSDAIVDEEDEEDESSDEMPNTSMPEE